MLGELFGLEVSDALWGDLWAISFALVWPSLALSAVPAHYSEPPAGYGPAWIRVLAGTILVPIASAYLLLIYAYALYILARWTLPRGSVAIVVCGFAAMGVATHLIAFPWRNTGHRWLRLYHRYFYPSLFLPIALLAVAVAIRVGDYGITEERYFLILIVAWLAFAALHCALKGRRLVVVPASLAVLLILASFGPWGAVSVSARSQVARLEAVLGETGILVEGRVARTGESIPFEDRQRISAIVSYLADTGKQSAIAPWFEGGDFDAGASADDNLAAMGVTLVREWEDESQFTDQVTRPRAIEVAGFEVLTEERFWARTSACARP